jgi:hypothetical protein
MTNWHSETMLINETNPTILPYDQAIDAASDCRKSDPEWKYTVEIEARTGLAKIALYDENAVKLGYL